MKDETGQKSEADGLEPEPRMATVVAVDFRAAVAARSAANGLEP